MALVGADVTLEGLLGAQVEEVVLRHQLLQLGLDVRDFVPAEFEFVQGDLGLLEISEESGLFWAEDEQGVAFAALATSRSAYSVDIFLLEKDLFKILQVSVLSLKVSALKGQNL